ncbi:hypothetical protein [Streptomyces sp. NPDC048312]|uniref:hypothetical protein n=1 Tax=Streptomyces sp. NPDC048312 TaxID=3155485 RepID=UPI0033E71707
MDETSVCELLSASQQEDIGSAEATPDADDGYASCYYSMTLDDDPDPSGYEVTVFDSVRALRETVDGTDVMPTPPHRPLSRCCRTEPEGGVFAGQA